MTKERDSQVEGKLVVIEEEKAFLVAWADDPEDWLARFEKSPDFPSCEWAENMVRVYNRRLSYGSVDPPTPRGTQPTSYHPEQD